MSVAAAHAPIPMVPVYELIITFGELSSVTGCGTALELQWMIDSGVFAEGDVTLGKILTHETAGFDKARDARRRAEGRS